MPWHYPPERAKFKRPPPAIAARTAYRLMKRDSSNGETPFTQLMQRRQQQQQLIPPSLAAAPGGSFLPRLPLTAGRPSGGEGGGNSGVAVRSAPADTRDRMVDPNPQQRLSSSSSAPFTPTGNEVGAAATGWVEQGPTSSHHKSQQQPTAAAATSSSPPLLSSSSPTVLTLRTPPKELLAVIGKLQSDLTARTDNVNAIQRNFERLSAMYRQDAQELSRVRAELQALREAQSQERRSSGKVSSVLQAELERSMAEVKRMQEDVEQLRGEKEALLSRCSDTDDTLKALQHEKRQLCSEVATLAARLADVEELLSDTQRELANEKSCRQAQQSALLSALTFLLSRTLSLLSPVVDGPAESGESGGGPSLDKESLLSSLDAGRGTSYMAGVLAEQVAPKVQALRDELRDARMSQERERLLSSLQDSHLTALVEREEELRDAVLAMESECRLALANTHHTVKTRELLYEQRRAAAADAAASAERRRTEQEAAAAAQREHNDTLLMQASYEAQLTKLKEERELMKDAMTKERADAVAAARQAALEEHNAAMARLRADHDILQQQREASHQAALLALSEEQSRQSDARAEELGELRSVIAQYTAQLEKQEELFAALQHQQDAEMASHERTAEEQRAAAAAAAAARAAAQAEHRHATDIAALLQLAGDQLQERLSLMAAEYGQREAIVKANSAAAMSVAVASAKGALQAQHANALDHREAMASALLAVADRESQGRLFLVTEEHAEWVGWLAPRTYMQALLEEGVRRSELTHKGEVEALRSAAARREESFSERLRELRGQWRDTEAELHAARGTEEALRAELKRSRDTLTASKGQLERQQRAILGAVERVLAAEEASESAYSCPQCFQLFDQPRTCVPCGHTFCQRCLLQHPRNKGIRDGSGSGSVAASGQPLYCPECGMVNAVATVEPKPLELLAGKFHYRKQVLEEIVRSHQQQSQGDP